MNKKAFLYLDNQMNLSERQAFELELQSSDEMRTELLLARELFGASQYPKLNNDFSGYSADVIGRFHASAERVKVRPWQFLLAARLSLLGTVAFSFLFSVMVFNSLRPGNILLQDISPADAVSILDESATAPEIKDELFASLPEAGAVIDNALDEELQLDSGTPASVLEEFNISDDDLAAALNPEEAENLFTIKKSN